MAPLGQRRTIADGFEAAIVERVARELLGVPVQSLLSALSLPSSTILRKIANEDRLSQNESDRIARVLYVLDLATELFEDRRRAAEWMTRGNAELEGLKPIEVLDVQPGYDRVRDILNRALFGVTA
jgi:putative toxin-antitoxin system antitoxin component (TIGR02293 family)